MLRMGFAKGWVDLIMRCVRSVSFSFKLNGERRGHIIPQIGLWQGDPLSPYLFLFCSEGLSALLQHQANERKVSSLKLSRHSPPITHLFFGLLFFKAKSCEARAIKECLKLYEHASCQMINHDKSRLACSPNAGASLKERMKGILSVSLVDCHHQYLGLPSFMPRNRVSNFDYIKESVRKQLQGWKGKLFSNGGKEVLIKAVVVQAIPCDSMSCSRLLKKLLHELNQLAIRFWWEEGRS